VVVVVAAAGISSAAAGGGVLCMLAGRDVSFGKVRTAPQNGVLQISSEGRSELRIGPETKVLRIERISPDQIRAGDEFIARNGNPASPSVVVYRDQMDLIHLYQAMGHGTQKRAAPVAKTASKQASSKKR
jgi:hypothetical protein